MSSMEERAQLWCAGLAKMKFDLAEELKSAQTFFRKYVTNDQYPIHNRFEVWAEWCEKKYHGCVIDEADVPFFGKIVQDDENDVEFFRHEVYVWLYFLELFSDDTNEAEEMRERYNVTIDEVKELLIETNFGSYTHDW